MNDSLGDRMKNQYEDRTRWMLPRRTWTIIRCDGKAFYSFTRGCMKPFDPALNYAMVEGTLRLVREAQGAKFAYLQSDEISVVLTDFDRIETQAWFDGNAQKIVSVAASVVTAGFGECYFRQPTFDARVFTIPDPVEVENYFIWRQKDAIRNSVQSLAQAHFSAKQLHGCDQKTMLAMLTDEGVEWGSSPINVQRGTAIVRSEAGWIVDEAPPVFTDDRDYLRNAWAIKEEPPLAAERSEDALLV